MVFCDSTHPVRPVKLIGKWVIKYECYNWWGFQARDTLQDSTGNSSIDNVETSMEWQEYFSQFQDMTDALPCHIHLPVCLWIMDPHSRAPKTSTSHGNEVQPQDTTYLIQRPCYERGSPCQDPAGNQTTWRPDRHKETQTAVVWSCLPFIWPKPSGKVQWKGEEYKADRGRDGKTTSGNGQAWSSQVPEGSGEQGKMEETGCKIICGAPTTFAVRDRSDMRKREW